MLGGEIVQIKRWAGTTKNAHGQSVDAWTDPETVADVGVDVPVVTKPRDGITANVRYDYQLYLPAGMTVGDRDRVIVRGHECSVEQAGEPIVHMFTAAAFRTEVMVRRVDR